MNTKPTQAKIASALGISPGRVSQLVKAGMPNYSIAAAQAWKDQHITPIMTPAKSVAAYAWGHVASAPVGGTTPEPLDLVAAASALGGHVEAALITGRATIAAVRVAALRDLLRRLPEGLSLRLPARVWVALLDYLLADDAKLRTLDDQAGKLTPAEVATHIGSSVVWPADLVLAEACDWNDWSLDIENSDEVEE